MEFTGKTVEEATATGLSELNLTAETAEIKVIEEPTKGLFGKLKGKAVVEITAKEESKKESEKPVKQDGKDGDQNAVNFIQKVLDIMDINAKAELIESEETTINLIAENSSTVIGYRGEVLDALQTLAGAVANIGKKDYKKVVVDCENYRKRREETLVNLAHRLEGKATEMRREVILEPMNPFERRIIHTALAESTTVTTKSDGKEPNRYVVIVPNDKDEFSKPYNAGRNNDKKGDRNFKGGRNDRRHGKGGFRNDGKRGGSGFTEEKRKAPSGFGTYLGNSLKDKE